jgi:hypothetical protein
MKPVAMFCLAMSWLVTALATAAAVPEYINAAVVQQTDQQRG